MNKKHLIVVLLLLFSCTFFVCQERTNTTNIAVAETVQENITNSEDGILDENLFSALLRNYNLTIENINNRVLVLSSDMFVGFESLDLSNYGISTLLGLELLDLSTVKTINLSNNNLIALSEESCEALKNTENLNLSANDLESFSADNFIALNNLNLDYNNISELDLTNLKEKDGIAKCSAISNKITSISNIELKSETTYQIDLQFNLITEVPSEMPENASFNIYFQNTIGSSNTASTVFKVFSGYSMPNFKVLAVPNEGESKTILAGSETTLAVSQYTFKFYNGENALYESDELTPIYKNISVTIKPEYPTIKAFVNGKQIYDITSVVGEIEFTFEASEGVSVYYSVNGNDFVCGNSVKISTVGMTRLSVYSYENGVSSSEEIMFFRINKKNNIPVSVTLILVLCGITFILFGIVFLGKKEINFNGKKKEKND